MARTAFVPAILASLLLLLWASTAQPQGEVKQRPVSTSPTLSHPSPGFSGPGSRRVTTRVAVGERAPDFLADRIDGRAVKLSSLRGDWLMLMFVERRESLDVAAPVAAALQGLGVRTAAICWGKSQALARQFAGRTPAYLPLADPTGDVLSLYGLLADDGTEAAQPGFVLIDPRGIVRLALLGQELPGDDASRLVQLAVRGE